jgi:hypothetical protein
MNCSHFARQTFARAFTQINDLLPSDTQQTGDTRIVERQPRPEVREVLVQHFQG